MWNRRKRLRQLVAEQALAAISASGYITVGTVYRCETGRRHKHSLAASELYAAMVHHIDHRLTAASEFGVVIVDGDGTDTTYRSAHRALPLETRHVIDDPLFQDSHVSQWVQMADLVAYAAYLHLLQPPGKEFAWGWHDGYLRACDVNGGPIKL